MFIKNYGLFWKADDVNWGARGSGKSGTLLGILRTAKSGDSVDFREQIGIYALYDDAFNLVYVGQAGTGKESRRSIYSRLKDHRTGDLSGRWTKFSWFGTKKVKSNGELFDAAESAQGKKDDFINQIEAVAIAIAEPRYNRRGGNFKDAEQYLQIDKEEK